MEADHWITMDRLMLRVDRSSAGIDQVLIKPTMLENIPPDLVCELARFRAVRILKRAVEEGKLCGERGASIVIQFPRLPNRWGALLSRGFRECFLDLAHEEIRGVFHLVLLSYTPDVPETMLAAASQMLFQPDVAKTLHGGVIHLSQHRGESPELRAKEAYSLVTGGASPLGAAVAHELAVEGRPLILTYHRRAEEAETLCRALHAEHGVDAVCFPLDLGSPESINALCEQLVQRDARIDCVVHAAGVGGAGASKQARTRAEINARIIGVNVVGTATLQDALEKRGLLHLEGSGTAVVVISSIGALRPFKGRHAIDDASKGMLQEWAGEVAERKGIHIWTLCPGAGENILPAGAANSAPMQEFLAQMPKQSLVPLRSIGHVIRFFGDPVHASYLNGQTLAAANGMHMDFREYAHPPRPNLRNLFFKSSRKRR